jgi:hypothetical protein
MSIINDALKKAARQRAQEENDLGSLMPGSHHGQSARGKKKNSTQTIVLVSAAALVLIVVSVVATGIFVTGKPQAAPAVAERPVPTPIAPVVEAAAPTVALVSIPRAVSTYPTPVAVAAERPAIALSPTLAPTAVPTAIPTAVPTLAPTAAPIAFPTAVPTEAPTPAALITLHPPEPVAPAATTPADQAHNDLVQGLVDRLQVSGVRAAGLGSKALVDGHVYRVNDVLDRTTGLKLVGVDEDHLTFVDAKGVKYVKTF